MADCFLFFRLWPGFDFAGFPVDRFNAIADDDQLSKALESWARKESKRREVRRQIEQPAIARGKDHLAAAQRRRGVMASRPEGFRKNAAGRQPEAKRAEPLVCRLGADLGWWRRVGDDPLPFGPRVWFYKVPSSELAEIIVSKLNGRTDLHFDDHQLEYYLQPRFGVVEDMDVALRISAVRCIKSIQNGKIPEVRSGEIALAMGRKAMAIADEMLEAAATPTPVQDFLAPRAPELTSNANSTPAAAPGEGKEKDADGTTPDGAANENAKERKPSRKGIGGKKPLPADEEKKRLDVLRDWWQANEAGIDQKQFCRDKGIKRNMLRRYVNWYSTRQSRNTNSG